MAESKMKKDLAAKAGTPKKGCCQRFKDAVSLVPSGVTPPDWGIMWLIFISLFTSSFTLTFLFPFLPEMILTFGYNEEEKGTYVGLVASSVFAGRAVGSFFWGWLSDKKGRRLVLLITIFFNGIFSFLFGFTHTLGLAMAVRFLAGLANGTVGVAKTVLYDISDNTNQAFSMSVISVAWGSGLIMGPTVGGYLALPASKYPGVFSGEGFFAHFPFILPSFCCLVVCGLAFLVVFFKFQEPALVRNTVSLMLADEKEAQDAEEEDGSLQRRRETGPATSQPLIDKPSKTSAAVYDRQHSGSSTLCHMSIENLHCESDLSHYLAEIRSQESRGRATLSDKSLSKSLHSLRQGVPPSTTDEEDGLEGRLRCYSVGEKPSRTSSGFTVGSKPNHVVPSILNREGSSSMGAEANVERAQRPMVLGLNGGHINPTDSDSAVGGKKQHAVVDLKAEEIEESSAKGRSIRRSCWQAVRSSSLLQLLRQSDVRHSVTLYTIMSFAVIGYEDVFTIFASTAKEYDGLGFSTDEIGMALGAVSIPLMFIQIKVYPFLVSKMGIKRAYLLNVFMLFIPMQIIPIVNLLADNKVWLWVCLVSLTLPLRVAANSCFTGSSLLINNSVTYRDAGKANGLGMTCTAIARTLAPTIGGAMFSWSLRMSREVGPPLDVNLTFTFFGLVLFITALHCVFLPEHLDHQKK